MEKRQLTEEEQRQLAELRAESARTKLRQAGAPKRPLPEHSPMLDRWNDFEPTVQPGPIKPDSSEKADSAAEPVAKDLPSALPTLPIVEIREPEEFIDQAWLRLVFFEECLLEGFRLSRPLVAGVLAADPRPLGSIIDTVRSKWHQAVHNNQATEQAQRFAQSLPAKFFPFCQIFGRITQLVAQGRVPSTWPLAVAALLDGLREGFRVQSQQFGGVQDTPTQGLPADNQVEATWAMVQTPPFIKYVGLQLSDAELIQHTESASGRITYRRLDKRSPELYRQIASSLVKGCSMMVHRPTQCELLVGCRLSPPALIFFGLREGAAYEVPFSEWCRRPSVGESVTLIDVDHFKPTLPYDPPNLLAFCP